MAKHKVPQTASERLVEAIRSASPETREEVARMLDQPPPNESTYNPELDWVPGVEDGEEHEWDPDPDA